MLGILSEKDVADPRQEQNAKPRRCSSRDLGWDVWWKNH